MVSITVNLSLLFYIDEVWKDKSPSWLSAPYLRERKSDVGLTICQE
ncbi:hypothetical protein A2U01_0020808, partial [Trifolium medium]|nr:hypothetical protein [Trifolium medium]